MDIVIIAGGDIEIFPDCSRVGHRGVSEDGVQGEGGCGLGNHLVNVPGAVNLGLVSTPEVLIPEAQRNWVGKEGLLLLPLLLFRFVVQPKERRKRMKGRE